MNSNKFRMVYKVDGNPQVDSHDWSMYSNILNWVDASEFTLDKTDSFVNWDSEGYLLEVDIRYPKFTQPS